MKKTITILLLFLDVQEIGFQGNKATLEFFVPLSTETLML